MHFPVSFQQSIKCLEVDSILFQILSLQTTNRIASSQPEYSHLCSEVMLYGARGYDFVLPTENQKGYSVFFINGIFC